MLFEFHEGSTTKPTLPPPPPSAPLSAATRKRAGAAGASRRGGSDSVLIFPWSETPYNYCGLDDLRHGGYHARITNSCKF